MGSPVEQKVAEPLIKVEPLIKMETKSIFSSKTFWMGFLEIVGGIVLAILGELQTGGTLTVAGVLTILLRVITKSGVRIGM